MVSIEISERKFPGRTFESYPKMFYLAFDIGCLTALKWTSEVQQPEARNYECITPRPECNDPSHYGL